MLPQQVVTKKHPTMEKKRLHYCSYYCRSYDLSFQKLNFDLLCSKILLLTEFFTLLLHQLEVHSTSYFCKSSQLAVAHLVYGAFFRLLAGRDAKIGCSLLLEDLCFQNEMGASLARLLSKHELEVSASKSLPNKTIQRSNIN